MGGQKEDGGNNPPSPPFYDGETQAPVSFFLLFFISASVF